VDVGKKLGVEKKHLFWFTEEASDDFIQLLTVVPQLVRFYAIQYETNKWIYIIPRRISNDCVENRFAKVRFQAGHNKLVGHKVLEAKHQSEVVDAHKKCKRLSKSNCAQVDVEAEASELVGSENGTYGTLVAAAAVDDEANHWRETSKLAFMLPLDAVKELKHRAAVNIESLAQAYAWLQI
jgi:hypothetical protein